MLDGGMCQGRADPVLVCQSVQWGVRGGRGVTRSGARHGGATCDTFDRCHDVSIHGAAAARLHAGRLRVDAIHQPPNHHYCCSFIRAEKNPSSIFDRKLLPRV